MKIKYVSDDGTEFSVHSQCVAYERLVLAAKNEEFDRAVQRLFHDCTSWESGAFNDSESWPVLRLEKGRSMDKFKANLVQAMPELMRLMDEAIKALPAED